MAKAALPIEDTEIEFDRGVFDSAAFAAQALSGWESLAGILDHTLLRPEATREQVENLCDEAVRYRFAAAVVNPVWAAAAVNVLAGTGIPVGAAIGFPLGASLASTLRNEAAALMRLGVRELDMVIPIGPLKSGQHYAVRNAVHAAADVLHSHGGVLKVILETALLSTEEKLRAAEAAIQAGADFLETSTGFSTAGATVDDIALMRGVAGSYCGVKALGGVHTCVHVRAMLDAGANRIGCSSSVAIVRELGAP